MSHGVDVAPTVSRAEAQALMDKCRTMEDLKMVQGELKARWQYLSSQAARKAASAFRVGDEVSFLTARGNLVGIVKKIGPKNIVVEVDKTIEVGGKPLVIKEPWRVAPMLLRRR